MTDFAGKWRLRNECRNSIQSNLFNTGTKWTDPLYRGVRIIEVGNVWFLAFLGPNELSVIERCPCYRGVRKERLDCTDDVSLVRSGYYAYYASDCSWREGNLLQPIKSTTQTWLVTRPQYGILAIVSQTSFRGGISRGVAKCRLFSQAT